VGAEVDDTGVSCNDLKLLLDIMGTCAAVHVN
jgi:hypothetical protein